MKSLPVNALLVAVLTLLVTAPVQDSQAMEIPLPIQTTLEVTSSKAESDLNLPILFHGADNSLKVKNQTPFIIIIYIGGKQVGWLKPYNTGIMRGLKTGYHRVYARSRWGSVVWGPKKVWVPGSWKLFR